MVSKIEYSVSSPASHLDEISHIPLDVGLSPFQTGHRLPGLIQRLGVEQTERSTGTHTGIQEPRIKGQWDNTEMYMLQSNLEYMELKKSSHKRGYLYTCSNFQYIHTLRTYTCMF